MASEASDTGETEHGRCLACGEEHHDYSPRGGGDDGCGWCGEGSGAPEHGPPCALPADPRDRAALRAVVRIVDDLSGRRGLRQEWAGIDRPTRIAIRGAWTAAIRAAMATEGVPAGGAEGANAR